MRKPVEEKAKWNRNNIRNMVLSVLVVLFFAGIILIYYGMLYETKRDNIIKDGELISKNSAEMFDDYLSTNIDSIKLTAYTLDGMIVENASDDEIQTFIVGQSTAIKSAVLENSTGLYGYINGRFFSGTNWIPPDDYVATDRPWYTRAISDKDNITLLDPYVDVQSGNVMLAIAKSLCDGESVIAVDVSLDQVQKMTEDAVSSSDSDIEMILNDKNVVVAHSDVSEVGKDYGREDNTLGAMISKQIGDSSNKSFEIHYDGFHYIVYVTEIRNGWKCIVVNDATNVFGSLNKILFITIFIVSAVILVIVTILVRTNRRRLMVESLSDQVSYLREDIDIAKRKGDKSRETIDILNSRISTIANIYMTAYELDVATDTFIELKSDSKIVSDIVGETRDHAQETVNLVMKSVCDASCVDDVLKFINLSTLNERLKNTDTIAIEYMNKSKLWRRARFIASMRDDKGNLARVMWLAEDIDNEKKERDRLIDMSERAIAASKAKSSFLSNMSHELRTPINTIIGMNEMVLRECEDNNVISYVENIRKAGNSLLGLVDEVLDFSRIEAGKLEIIAVDYKLSSMIDDIVSMEKGRAEEKGLVLTVDLDKNTPDDLNGDEMRIKQVINNLVANAIKYTEKGGVVLSVGYENLTDKSILLNVSVKDSGIGIKAEDMERLFGDFERIDADRNSNVEGIGLGMSITRSLLDMMGSSLKVESAYGLGSRFYFSLEQKITSKEE
jgi:signal transduction histidine kinase